MDINYFEIDRRPLILEGCPYIPESKYTWNNVYDNFKRIKFIYIYIFFTSSNLISFGCTPILNRSAMYKQDRPKFPFLSYNINTIFLKKMLIWKTKKI